MALVKKLVSMSVLVVLIALMPACQGKADESHAPDFSLLNLSGDLVNLSDYSGKVVIINFFATYCPPCRMELPDFVTLQKKYSRRGFTVLGISVDTEPEKILPPFVERMHINFPVLIATSKVLRDYGNIYALPVTFILDKDHKIYKKITGMVNQDELEPIIEELLSASAKQAK